ncbi:MAG TPA: putative quinol monooxygenase [Gallionella sp.]|nr:putative quinol monooxygenase [Gallionella sp.]
MFLLFAELSARPEACGEVERILSGLLAVARSEPGNVSYAIHRQIESPQDFMVYELYRDREACDAHLAATPVQQALKQFESLLVRPPRVVFCETVGVCSVPG